MIKLVAFLVRILVIVGLAIYIADRSGRVTIEWQDSVIETSTFVLIIAITLAVAAAIMLVRVADRIRALPARYRLHRQLREQKKGQYFLSQAIEALGMEKKRRAFSFLKRAEKFLGPSQFIDLVKSQTQPPNVATAALADYSSPYAWREAILQLLKEERMAEARALAERFANKHPALPLSRKLLLDIYMQSGDWDAAISALDQLRVGHVLPRKDIRTMKAAVFAERAREAILKANPREGFEWAMQADRLRASWIPAIQQAVAALAAQDKPREAASLIAQVWPNAAHPQLAHAFLALKTGKNDLKTAQEAEKIARKMPEHPASQLLLAKAFLRANLLGQARHYAGELVKLEPSRSAYLLLAAVAEAEHDRAAMDAAHDNAITAPPDAAWICRECKQPYAHWQALCKTCKGFDTLAWGAPPRLIESQT